MSNDVNQEPGKQINVWVHILVDRFIADSLLDIFRDCRAPVIRRRRIVAVKCAYLAISFSAKEDHALIKSVLK